MEYLERGDLYSMLRNPQYDLSWQNSLLGLAVNTCRGMAYLHSAEPPIIHRDLKSMNIHIG